MTLDGITVELWSDGWLTSRMGTKIGKLPNRYEFHRASMWVVLDMIELLDHAEIKPMLAHWRRARALVGATDATARAEVRRRMTPPRKPAPPGPDALYRALQLANGMTVDIRIR
ncbi:hypothetical protein [Metallibacterium sp.]